MQSTPNANTNTSTVLGLSWLVFSTLRLWLLKIWHRAVEVFCVLNITAYIWFVLPAWQTFAQDFDPPGLGKDLFTGEGDSVDKVKELICGYGPLFLVIFWMGAAVLCALILMKKMNQSSDDPRGGNGGSNLFFWMVGVVIGFIVISGFLYVAYELIQSYCGGAAGGGG